MSDYVPPENPYDAPREDGTSPGGRSRGWVIAIVAIVLLILVGVCGCGMVGWLFTVRSTVPPQPAPRIESAPVNQPPQPVLKPAPSGDRP